MRYVVLGCGAIGATVAAALARDGHDVLVTDPAADALPLVLDGPVLVDVRAGQLSAAAAILAVRLDGAGYAVCLRHGLDAGILAAAIGPERVAVAAAGRTELLVGELANPD
ncbi:MAG TPA: 2-dehydropantoate 2-reductase N-terminal domain-containing protein, partial [Streptosporangiaceae bacterium]|nr:2-dehydropantoate 2-reductase N-terminal domain-containing protein [Streptosporangiaceae bacterium]